MTVPKRGLAVAPRAVLLEAGRPGDDGALGRPFDDHQGTRHEPAVVHQRAPGRRRRPGRTSGRAGRRRPRRRARRAASARNDATEVATTRAREKPRVAALRAINAAVRRSCSTIVTTPAPRDHASSPTAPEPAYRSRKRSPSSDPVRDSIAENNASRTRSLVGRVVWPRGVSRRRPPAVPPMMRVMSPWSALLHELRRRGALHLGDDVGQGGRRVRAPDPRRVAPPRPSGHGRSSSRRAIPEV